MKKFFIPGLLLVLIIVVVILFCNMRGKGNKSPVHSSDFRYRGELFCTDYPKYDKGQIIRHSGYTLQYSENNEQAAWVMYLLTREKVQDNHIRRNDNFKSDPLVQSGSALPSDYTRTGFDKGHLCPAADMGWSEQTMKESFYMSNMSPQVPAFNRGIWKELEEKIRNWAKDNDSLVVITGPVLKGHFQRIGYKNKVSVPLFYYKVVADISYPEYKMIAFVMRNEGSQQNIFDFAVTPDSVEEVTGIDFFPDIQGAEVLESQIEISEWE